jgi:hypothetical protein
LCRPTRPTIPPRSDLDPTSVRLAPGLSYTFVAPTFIDQPIPIPSYRRTSLLLFTCTIVQGLPTLSLFCPRLFALAKNTTPRCNLLQDRLKSVGLSRGCTPHLVGRASYWCVLFATQQLRHSHPYRSTTSIPSLQNLSLLDRHVDIASTSSYLLES